MSATVRPLHDAADAEMTDARTPPEPSDDFALERFTPGTFGPKSAYEHWTRYLYAARYVAGKDVLDYGCGTGYGSAFLAERANEVLAVDVSPEAVAYAGRHHAHPRVRYEASADPAAAVESGSRDVIVAFEVIEHLREQDALIAAFARILRPSGVLLLSTPEPQYTATLGPNPFHVRELQLDELEALIGRHFSHRQVLVQCPVIGEALWPAGDAGCGDETAAALRVVRYDKPANVWASTVGRPGPTQSYVVVASHEPVDATTALVMSDRDERLVEDLRTYIRRLEQERQHLHDMVLSERSAAAVAMREATAAHDVVRQALEATRGELAARDQALRAAETRAAELEQARTATEAALTTTKGELTAARAALVQSEADLGSLRDDLAYVERKVGLRYVGWALRGVGKRLRRRFGA